MCDISHPFPLKSLLLLSAALLSLSACGTFQFSTNVDPDNFRKHFRSSAMEIYTPEQMVSSSSYEDLGMVEGSDCQVNDLYPPPREGVARKEMLEKAADLGATGVSSVKCVLIHETEACTAEYACYATAIRMEEDSQDTTGE